MLAPIIGPIAASKTVTLSTFTQSGADLVGEAGTPWGEIAGLAPADINYSYGDTLDLTVDGGGGGNTWNIDATGGGGGSGGGPARTNTINGGNGGDTFNIDATDLGLNATNGAARYNSTNDINGGSGDDTFNVTGVLQTTDPTHPITLNINGGLPPFPSNPGDTLNVAAGTVVSPTGPGDGEVGTSIGTPNNIVTSYTSIERTKTVFVDLSDYPEVRAWAERVKALVPNYEEANGKGAKVFEEFFRTKTGLI